MASPNSEIEVEVRRYLTKTARRYAPGALIVLMVAAAVALVPPKHGTSTIAAGGPGSGLSAGGSPTGGAGDSSASAGTGASGSAAAGPGGATAGPASSGPGGPASAGQSTPQAVGDGGVARSGVPCSPGARQVTWSRYAPGCVAAFSGNNGGSTTPGVTKDTVTVSYRYGNSASMSALKAAAGAAASSLGGDQQQMVADLQTYIALFNKNFELYGRKVVLKAFTGQGDFLQEYTGSDAAGAQQDAATAKDMGAFADLSTITQTQLYAEALGSQRIVSFGAVYLSQSWFDRHAPYAYSYFPAGTRVASFIGNLTCQRLAGLPATFAGDPTFQHTTRVFGIMNPENPDYAAAGDLLASKLAACGQTVAKHVAYSLNVETMAQQDTNAVAQLHAAGVTTVLCLCDEFSPIYLTQSSDQQQYRPEWVSLWWPDPWGRLASQDQQSHALAAGGATPAIVQTEAYRVYKLANPSGPPSGDLSYPLAYQQAVMLFDGLQSAGPNLTAPTMAAGFFSLPSSQPGGDMGPWAFGSRVYTPKSAFQLGWWNANARSGLDGSAGAWQNCGSGAWVPFDDPRAFDPSHTQPNCFGR